MRSTVSGSTASLSRAPIWATAERRTSRMATVMSTHGVPPTPAEGGAADAEEDDKNW